MRRHRDGWLGQVRIGSSTTALIYHLPPVLARLRREHPNIELVVTTGTTTGVVERMLRNEIDLGIVSLPINERLLDLVPLKQEQMVAIFSEHTENLPAKVTPQYLLQHTLILEYARAHVRALTMSWLAGDGAEVRPAMELDNLEAVRRMVAAGLGASVVPASVVSEAHPGTERRLPAAEAGADRARWPWRSGATSRATPRSPHVREALLSLAEGA